MSYGYNTDISHTAIDVIVVLYYKDIIKEVLTTNTFNVH